MGQSIGFLVSQSAERAAGLLLFPSIASVTIVHIGNALFCGKSYSGKRDVLSETFLANLVSIGKLTLIMTSVTFLIDHNKSLLHGGLVYIIERIMGALRRLRAQSERRIASDTIQKFASGLFFTVQVVQPLLRFPSSSRPAHIVLLAR